MTQLRSFDRYFVDSTYLQLKDNLFNYLVRKRAIHKCLRGIPSDQLVLDVGSGVSPVTPYPGQTTFLDISPEAATHLSEQGHKAVVGDAQRLCFAKEKFSIVLCSEVLEHVADDRLALSELFRVLKPHGALVLTVPVHAYFWGGDDEFVGHHRRYNVDSLKELVEGAGGVVVGQVKVSGLLGRVSTWSAAMVFKFFSKETSSMRLLPSWLLATYKFVNRVGASVLRLDAWVWPVALSSVVLLECKKIDCC